MKIILFFPDSTTTSMMKTSFMTDSITSWQVMSIGISKTHGGSAGSLSIRNTHTHTQTHTQTHTSTSEEDTQSIFINHDL